MILVTMNQVQLHSTWFVNTVLTEKVDLTKFSGHKCNILCV